MPENLTDSIQKDNVIYHLIDFPIEQSFEYS